METVSAEFVAEVEANVDNAIAEGFEKVKSTALTVGMTIGVLLAQAETLCDANTVRVFRKTILLAIGAL